MVVTDDKRVYYMKFIGRDNEKLSKEFEVFLKPFSIISPLLWVMDHQTTKCWRLLHFSLLLSLSATLTVPLKEITLKGYWKITQTGEA